VDGARGEKRGRTGCGAAAVGGDNSEVEGARGEKRGGALLGALAPFDTCSNETIGMTTALAAEHECGEERIMGEHTAASQPTRMCSPPSPMPLAAARPLLRHEVRRVDGQQRQDSGSAM
jgi:hypothetical protein